MKTLHLKSPCCQEIIYQHGGKRRACSYCGKTWTIRPKRRGRKLTRRFQSLVKEILVEGAALNLWAKRHRITTAAASQQLHRAFKKFIMSSTSAEVPLSNSYVLLADGFWFSFERQSWTMFLLALKPVSEDRAYFLDPILLPGGESYENWSRALSTIPSALKKQVKAIISDGFRASSRISEEQGWIHQRCHFHLIASLQVRRGKRKKQLAGVSLREAIYQTIMELLRTQNKQRVKTLSVHLKRLSDNPNCPRSMRMIVAEFLRALPEFRAYLSYPELRLPTTTGSIETMGKLIRKRVYSIRTVKALKLWATAIIRLKSPITCNCKKFSTELT